MSDDLEYLELLASAIESETKAGFVIPAERLPDVSNHLRAIIKQGWAATYAFFFDKPDRPFVANLSRYHRRALRWHWISRHRICRGQKPRWYAYFPILPRGMMKSTMARYLSVIDAVISLSYGVPGYCLFFSGTTDKTLAHAISIEKILQSPKIKRHAPKLAQVGRAEESEKDKLGRKLGWRATFFHTAANYAYHFASLQTGLAGANLAGVRITQMIPDDIDDRKDSPVLAENNFQLLTNEILPMGASGTLVFWAQNLISRYSCMYRIFKGHARVLTNRMKAIPVPAVRGMETEVRTIDGTIRDIIVQGTATAKAFDLEWCQEEMNRMGLPAFLREMQHEVDQSVEGLMIHNYQDHIHPISISEFARIYGTREMPRDWPKEWGNDWARTKTAKHANVALWRTVSSQNSKLPGFTFYWHPMSFPANSQPEDVAERVLSCLSPYVTEDLETRLTSQVDKGHPRQTWAELRRDELIRANALAHTRTSLERMEFERNVLQEIFPQYTEPILRRHNVLGGVNSHERDDIRLLYNQVYSLQCKGVNPGKFGGIEQLNRDFAVDETLEHPFRPGVMGYSRTFIVVPDDESRPPWISDHGPVYPPAPYPEALTPDDLHDDKLIRYQFSNFRLAEPKLTETGERIDEPLKMDDDFVQTAQFFAMNGAIPNIPLSVQEEYKMLREENLPKPEHGPIVMTKKMQQTIRVIDVKIRRELEEKHGETAFEPEYEDVDEGIPNWWN